MTVLVFGPYPPSPGEEAAETFALVRGLLEAGDTVTVVSPVPSAAHDHVDVGSPVGALGFWRMVAGHDRVIVRLDAAGLLAAADPPRLIPARAALGRALRRAGRGGTVELHLDRVPPTVSARWVAAVVVGADVVTVTSVDQRDSLVAAGADASRIRVRGAPEASGGAPRGRELPTWSGTTREALQRDVRRRAAAVRAGHATSQPEHRSSAAAPLREIAPLGHAPVRSPKPGVAYVKRLVRKLVGWQLDPVIQHVNRLHQATVAAVDRLDPHRDPGGSAPSGSAQPAGRSGTRGA